jgi:regulator of cell morphogenesis and NO signaling
MDRPDSSARSLDLMCAEIVERYHAALHRDVALIRAELPALCADADSAALQRVRDAAGSIIDQIEAHLAKEEHLLFPAIETLAAASRAGQRRPPMPFVALVHPIRAMEAEHLRIEAAMDRLGELVLDVPEPDSRRPAWRRCLDTLARLDRDLHDHLRDEADILFPRALELEHQLLV